MQRKTNRIRQSLFRVTSEGVNQGRSSSCKKERQTPSHLQQQCQHQRRHPHQRPSASSVVHVVRRPCRPSSTEASSSISINAASPRSLPRRRPCPRGPPRAPLPELRWPPHCVVIPVIITLLPWAAPRAVPFIRRRPPPSQRGTFLSFPFERGSPVPEQEADKGLELQQ